MRRPRQPGRRCWTTSCGGWHGATQRASGASTCACRCACNQHPEQARHAGCENCQPAHAVPVDRMGIPTTAPTALTNQGYSRKFIGSPPSGKELLAGVQAQAGAGRGGGGRFVHSPGASAGTLVAESAAGRSRGPSAAFSATSSAAGSAARVGSRGPATARCLPLTYTGTLCALPILVLSTTADTSVTDTAAGSHGQYVPSAPP